MRTKKKHTYRLLGCNAPKPIIIVINATITATAGSVAIAATTSPWQWWDSSSRVVVWLAW
jgi:hypothetical protein